ncbi:MAG: hypothetical protein DRP42_06915 [Tenericutes bacterium]|nr:MAG: hypothetical protein DRP42_06915 [Mycoplasmatota bacterium]
METTTQIKTVDKKISGRDTDTVVIITTKTLKLKPSGKEKQGMEHLSEVDLRQLLPEELEGVKHLLDGSRKIKSTIQ